jgi:hypothetical protein
MQLPGFCANVVTKTGKLSGGYCLSRCCNMPRSHELSSIFSIGDLVFIDHLENTGCTSLRHALAGPCRPSGRHARVSLCCRKPAQRPWLEAGCSRLTWYRRRKQVREREALTVVATAREAVFDRLDWQLARLRRELETAARFANEGAVIITELAGYSGSSGR